jgi:hypothetical protein
VSFSYSGDPTNSSLDQIRFLLDDREPPPFLEDEEIAYQVSLFPNVLRAAAVCAEQIAVQLGKKAQSKSVSGLSLSRPELRRSYVELAAQLRQRALREGNFDVSAGGLSEGEKLDQISDADAVQPAFRRRTGQVGRSDPRRGWN